MFEKFFSYSAVRTVKHFSSFFNKPIVNPFGGMPLSFPGFFVILKQAVNYFFKGSKFWEIISWSFCYRLIPVGFIDVTTYCFSVYSIYSGNLANVYNSSENCLNT